MDHEPYIYDGAILEFHILYNVQLSGKYFCWSNIFLHQGHKIVLM